jgi:hypothetical protein
VSGVEQVSQLKVMAPDWTVPANLADFECAHGRLGDCGECHVDEQQVDEQLELDLEAVI